MITTYSRFLPSCGRENEPNLRRLSSAFSAFSPSSGRKGGVAGHVKSIFVFINEEGGIFLVRCRGVEQVASMGGVRYPPKIVFRSCCFQGLRGIFAGWNKSGVFPYVVGSPNPLSRKKKGLTI